MKFIFLRLHGNPTSATMVPGYVIFCHGTWRHKIQLATSVPFSSTGDLVIILVLLIIYRFTRDPFRVYQEISFHSENYILVINLLMMVAGVNRSMKSARLWCRVMQNIWEVLQSSWVSFLFIWPKRKLGLGSVSSEMLCAI